MTQLYEYAGLFIVLFWVMYRTLFPFVSNKTALGVSAVVVCLLPLAASPLIFILVAMFAPFGAVLPALALQNIAIKSRLLPTTTFPPFEVVITLSIYVLFLCAALAVFEFDPYRYGYYPAFGSIMAFCLCGYALLRRYWFIASAVILGQAAWMLDIGSTNYFDHVTHVLLVPVIVVVLIKSLPLFRRKASHVE
jgi:hypothetical protein